MLVSSAQVHGFRKSQLCCVVQIEQCTAFSCKQTSNYSIELITNIFGLSVIERKREPKKDSIIFYGAFYICLSAYATWYSISNVFNSSASAYHFIFLGLFSIKIAFSFEIRILFDIFNFDWVHSFRRRQTLSVRRNEIKSVHISWISSNAQCIHTRTHK